MDNGFTETLVAAGPHPSLGNHAQTYARVIGRPIRWTFSNLRDRSFTWQGHSLDPDGNTWRLEIDIAFQRI